jgi:hypothetical protein
MSREAGMTRRADPLWVPVVAPVVWSAHFMVCYIWAALACGRFRAGGEGTLDAAIAATTLLALAVIAATFLRALVQLRYQLPQQPSDDPTPGDRARFMAFTTLLLAGLSGIGTLYVGAAAWLVGGCQ